MKMLWTGHIGDWNAVVHQVPGTESLVMKALMHHRHELDLHSFYIYRAMALWAGPIYRIYSQSTIAFAFSTHTTPPSPPRCNNSTGVNLQAFKCMVTLFS